MDNVIILMNSLKNNPRISFYVVAMLEVVNEKKWILIYALPWVCETLFKIEIEFNVIDTWVAKKLMSSKTYA